MQLPATPAERAAIVVMALDEIQACLRRIGLLIGHIVIADFARYKRPAGWRPPLVFFLR